MTSQRVERTWIHTGGYGRFRGEWVKFSVVTLPLNAEAHVLNVYTNPFLKLAWIVSLSRSDLEELLWSHQPMTMCRL